MGGSHFQSDEAADVSPVSILYFSAIVVGRELEREKGGTAVHIIPMGKWLVIFTRFLAGKEYQLSFKKLYEFCSFDRTISKGYILPPPYRVISVFKPHRSEDPGDSKRPCENGRKLVKVTEKGEGVNFGARKHSVSSVT